MTTTEALERDLRDDLRTLRERGGDDRFCERLYRALANRRWGRDEDGGHVALSHGLAADVVNELREAADKPHLPLRDAGGEGELDDDVRRELEGLGWHSHPLDTSTHSDEHRSAPADSPPPRDAGERQSPTDRSPTAERAEAHAEADRNRR